MNAALRQVSTAVALRLSHALERVVDRANSIPVADETSPGFIKIGTEHVKFYDLSGHPSRVTWDVYQKN